MAQHILISCATRRPYRDIPTIPDGAHYDSAKGYWLKDSGPLVTADAFAAGPVTKKCDHETGEDQKGE